MSKRGGKYSHTVCYELVDKLTVMVDCLVYLPPGWHDQVDDYATATVMKVYYVSKGEKNPHTGTNLYPLPLEILDEAECNEIVAMAVEECMDDVLAGEDHDDLLDRYNEDDRREER